MRRVKVVLIVILAAIAFFFVTVLIWGIRAGQGSFGADLRRSFSVGQSEHTQNIDLEGIQKIRLDYDAVDLTIEQGSGSQMVLTEYFSGDPKEDSYARLQRNVQEGAVTVTQGDSYLGFWFFSLGNGIRRAEITIPEAYAGKLVIQTDSGNVDAENLTCGEFTVTAGSGDIRLEGLKGQSLAVTTGSGNVTASECRGSFTVETGSGDMRIEEQSGGIRAETGSGDVDLTEGSGIREVKTGSGDIQMDSGEDAIRVETSSGDVCIRKLENSSFSLQTETTSGDLSGSIIRQMDADEEERNYQGVYGDTPRFQVEIKTASGDIKLD